MNKKLSCEKKLNFNMTFNEKRKKVKKDDALMMKRRKIIVKTNVSSYIILRPVSQND